MNKTLFYVTCIFFIISSCVKGVDFSQVEDAKLKTEIAHSLIYFNISSKDVHDLEASQESIVFSDTTYFPIKDANSLENNLSSIGFNFEITSTFNREVDIEITFIDDSLNPTFNFNLLRVEADQEGLSYYQVLSKEVLANIFNTEKVIFNVYINSGTPIYPDDDDFINFKSLIIYQVETI